MIKPDNVKDPQKRYSELDIKILLIEFLMQQLRDQDHVIAVEAKYASNLRRADVLAICEQTYAYEIKSDYDRLDKLSLQLKDYRRTFDRVFVVTTKKHIKNVRAMLAGNDGLILVDDNHLQIIRESQTNEMITKKNLAAICSRGRLSAALGKHKSNSSIEELRAIACRRFTKPQLQTYAIEELNKRFITRYETFLSEATLPLRETDLKALRHGDRLFF